MGRLDDVVAKSVELNKAIKELNKETKVLNNIVLEKRAAKKEEILNDLMKYAEIMASLNIDVVEFKTGCVMNYYSLTRRLGIKIRRHNHGVQIDLGCLSDVMSGFYAFHSIGWVVSGLRNKEILDGFCDKWDYIKKDLDSYFAEEIEHILETRKEKAIAEREVVIKNLTVICK